MIFTIYGSLSGLNEYTLANRKNRYVGAELKWENELIVFYATKDKTPIKGRVNVSIAWYEKDNKRDADNVIFAKKFILDSLVAQGILQGDGRKYISSFRDEVYTDKLEPRIEVTINELWEF